MKRHTPTLFSGLLAVTDVVMTFGAFLAAYGLRYHTGLRAPRGVAAFDDTFAAMTYVLVIWLVVFHACGLYQSRHATSTLDEFYSVFIAVTLSSIAFLAAAFLAQAFFYSRGVLALAWALDILFVTAVRGALRAGLKRWWRSGRGLRRVWLVGDEEAAAGRLFNNAEYGTSLVGQSPTAAADEELIAAIDWDSIEEIVIVEPSPPLDAFRGLLSECERGGVEARYLPSPADLLRRQGTLEVVNGVPLITFRAGPAQFWQQILKRALDIAVALFMLTLFGIPMIIIALLVKATSRGPAIIKQQRVGKNGQPFGMYKFRTMLVDAQERAGYVQSGGDNPHKTTVGVWLRRFSLDELPQFLNILKGEMSIVGPRPEQPHFVEQLCAGVPGYRHRHRVKTGLTGWAQVHDLRGSTSIEERTRYDLYYVENWSILLDLKIILKTAFEFLFHRSAR